MATSKARQRATAKYEAKAYDKTLIRLPKGRLDEIRAHIEPAGESLNGFIGRAITETMERDGGGDTVVNHDGSSGAAGPGAVQQKAAETSAGAGVISLPPDTLKAAQEAAEYAMETVPEFLSRAVTAQAQRDQGPTDMIFLPKDVVKDAFCGGFAFGESARAFIIRAIHELVEKEKPMWDDEVYQLKTLEELAMEGGIVSLPFGALDLMDMGAAPEGGKRPEKLQRTADTLRNKFLKKG